MHFRVVSYLGGEILSFKRSYKSWIYTLNIYECDRCHNEIDESHPHSAESNEHYCWDCSFIKGLITEIEYCSCGGISPDMFAAGINPRTNEIEIVRGKCKAIWRNKHREYIRTSRGKFSWEMSNYDYRQTVEYKKWRNSVFERDNYTCMQCGTHGGDLNAHHVKSFARHKTLRFIIENGITLCVPCHKIKHKKSKKIG